MSRNLFPAVLAIGLGVWTGFHTFQPAFQEAQEAKDRESVRTQHAEPSQGQKTDHDQPSKPTSNGETGKPSV
ncbi:hypothetical protein BO70DRAFT_364363 [Aspergillus heteromorphus CBS 117.55]|uniref:Uncharacterized protein n=1 Tax=Aspergillus heteromorphus CBS 117.55 TaxID=1448321 RepID=A0A317VNH2_9EURO|nr:uncharacterized protein BO70DRAFT_364363 [Aspergillus heteromorphus CBS 117.55]PWY74402.1 hypothetical protein BO70DRAFT_364363 [Aspergillus heteromorphus CBS 117.55]